MSWLSGYTHRFPVMVDITASASTADRDVTFTIPKGLRDFWDNVLSNGYDIRVTEQDGITELEYRRQTWDKATFSGVINALGDSGSSNAWGPPVANSASLLWLYCGNSGASDGAVITAPTGLAANGYLTAGVPSAVIRYAPEAPEATIASQVITKSASDQLTVWVDFSAALGNLPKKASNTYASSVAYEEIAYANFLVHTGGADQAALYTEASTRFWGRGLVRVTIHAGTHGTDYVGILSVGTCNPDETGIVRVLYQRFLIQVRTVDES